MMLVKIVLSKENNYIQEIRIFFCVFSWDVIHGICSVMSVFAFLLQNMNEQYLGDIFFDASLMIWSIALAVVTQMGLCSAFICTLWVAFPLLVKLMIHKEFSQKGMNFEGGGCIPKPLPLLLDTECFPPNCCLSKRNPKLQIWIVKVTMWRFCNKEECSWTKDSLKVWRSSLKKKKKDKPWKAYCVSS